MTPARNFASEVVGGAPADARALVERQRDGRRRTWTFGEIDAAAGHLAGELVERGVGRGDVVLTVLGSRADWVLTIIACFRIGAVVLPCPEQLRAHDLRVRMAAVRPALVVADARNRDEVVATGARCEILWTPEPGLHQRAAIPAPVPLAPEDPALITFTSGTTGSPRPVVHGQRYLWGQALQARAWLGSRPGDLVWCTATPGWSKAARNAFLAPWLRGAAALLHDRRFDAEERLGVIREEGVRVLCMAPTEYRMIAARADLGALPSLRQVVAAGETLDVRVLEQWRETTGLTIRDGYGQTETGQLTGTPPHEIPRPGSMGRPLPGVKLWSDGGELVLDPATSPTFFLRYGGAQPPQGAWRTGDRVQEDEDGYLWFGGRGDDVIISAGYRIGPEEVEAALLAHDAVADAAVVPAPDAERGAVVRAVVVTNPGWAAGPALARELQEFVKRSTAPYKYPRIVDFAETLPRTPSGKLRRSALREG